MVYYAGLAAEHWLSRFSWIALVIAVIVGIAMTYLLRERTARLIRELDDEHNWETAAASLGCSKIRHLFDQNRPP